MKFYVRSVFFLINLTAIVHGSRITAHDFKSTVLKCCGKGKGSFSAYCEPTQKEIELMLVHRDPDKLYDACALSYRLCCVEERSSKECEEAQRKALNGERIAYYNTVEGNCHISCVLGMKTGKQTGSCELEGSTFRIPFTKSWMECCFFAINQPKECEMRVSCNGHVWSTSTNYTRDPRCPPCAPHSPPDTSPQVAEYSSPLCGNDTVPCEEVEAPPPRDVCHPPPCGDHAVCVALSAYKFRCEPICESGLELAPNRTVCVDIDECARGLHSCGRDAICRNVHRHFICDCRPGYEWKNGQCVDINECNNKAVCVHNQCINTPGSFECICKQGYEFMHGQCVDINECTRGGCPQNQECINLPGSYRCACSNGLTLVDNECRDICPSGYQLRSDGKICVDINECENSNVCFPQACWNIPGSYRCHPYPQCPPHYRQINSTTCVSPDGTFYIIFENYNVRLKHYLLPGGAHIYQQDAKDCSPEMVDCNLELKNSFDTKLKSHFELRRSSNHARKTVTCSVYLVKPLLSEMEVKLQLNTTIFKQSFDYPLGKTLVPARAYVKYVNMHVYKSPFDRNP